MPARFPRVKIALALAFLLAVAGLAMWLSRKPVPAPENPIADPEGRVAAARARCGEKVASHFRTAGVAYPPRELFLRAFKHEAELEVWARDAAQGGFTFIHRYAITRSSGKPGPKRREGDRQVPEGFYTLDLYNPLSSYHLSVRIDYPNASDRILSDRARPGFDIYLHGGDGSVGCLPVGDAAIEELYLMTLDAGNRGRIPIHIFPARMSGAAWENFAAPLVRQDPALGAFWENLRPGYEAFERSHEPPSLSVASDGRYVLTPR